MYQTYDAHVSRCLLILVLVSVLCNLSKSSLCWDRFPSRTSPLQKKPCCAWSSRVEVRGVVVWTLCAMLHLGLVWMVAHVLVSDFDGSFFGVLRFGFV